MTDKLSAFCVEHFSGALWTAIEMAEAGIPMDRDQVLYHEQFLADRCTRLNEACVEHLGLLLEGQGSGKAKDAFLDLICDTIDGVKSCLTAAECRIQITQLLEKSSSSSSEPSSSSDSSSTRPPARLVRSVRDHPQLTRTPKQGKISFSDENRNLLLSLLPRRSPLARGLRLVGFHSAAQKLRSSYTFPLLFHRRNRPADRSSVLIPPPGVPPCSSHELPSHSTTPQSNSSEKSATTAPKLPSPRTCPSPSASRSSSRKQTLPPGSPSPTSSSSPPSSPSSRMKLPVQLLSRLPLSAPSSTSTSAELSPSPGPSATPRSSTPTSPSSPGRWRKPPRTSRSWTAYPTWYIVPTFMKEGAGDPGGTLQGRPTCKKPAAQTFPPLLKGCIVSRFPGGFLLSNDLSQIELRVPTLLSGDEALVRNYQLGLDLHTDRARSIFDTNEVDKLQRQVGKTINFADLYLAMAKTMRATVLQMTGLNMPLSFFQRIVDARYSERTGLTLWQVEQCRTAARQGYIELPFTGQSRMFDGFVFDEKEWGKNHRIQQVKRHPEDPDVVHEIVNFPIQTIAGNLMLQIQREVSDLLGLYKSPHPDIRMFLNIYDAVWFDCRRQKDVDLAQQAFDHVVNNCRYWQMLQDLYGREVPLAYESSVAA